MALDVSPNMSLCRTGNAPGTWEQESRCQNGGIEGAGQSRYYPSGIDLLSCMVDWLCIKYTNHYII